MVVIFMVAAPETGNTQLRVACPSTCTVHAPQSALPQPYLLPVMLRWSRRTHSNGVSGSTSVSTCLPLIFRLIMETPMADANDWLRAVGKWSRARPDRHLMTWRDSKRPAQPYITNAGRPRGTSDSGSHRIAIIYYPRRALLCRSSCSNLFYLALISASAAAGQQVQLRPIDCI